jgi:hypothetical protein
MHAQLHLLTAGKTNEQTITVGLFQPLRKTAGQEQPNLGNSSGFDTVFQHDVLVLGTCCYQVPTVLNFNNSLKTPATAQPA